MPDILAVTSTFHSVHELRMHVERHHGLFVGDIKNFKTLHAMHKSLHDPKEPGFSRSVPHLHSNINGMRMEKIGG